MSISVPIKLLYEAENNVITIEIKSGEMFRGYLMEASDSMNVRMDDVTLTARDGKVSRLDQVYLRGSQIRFIIVPDMLKNSPMFKTIKNQTKAATQANISRGKVRGRGAQAAASRGKQIVASVNLIN